MIFINQLREKVGVVYGNPEVTTGGRALKFYASMRIDVRRIEQLKAAGNEFVGSRTRAKIVKIKWRLLLKRRKFDIMYGKGISREGELLDIGVKLDIIQKSGAWFSYGDSRLGQGRDNVKELFRTNTELADEIEGKIRANLGKLTNDRRAAPAAGAKEQAAPSPPLRRKAAPAAKPTTRAAARAKLDIAVDDDEA